MFGYFDSEERAKQYNLERFMCSGEYQNSFFKSFSSFSDAKKNVKALVALPIIDFSLALHAVLRTLVLTTFGVANIAIGAVTFDLDELKRGGTNLKEGARMLVGALYYAVSIITDTLAALARLVTHSLATVALGACKTLEAISSSGHHQSNF